MYRTGPATYGTEGRWHLFGMENWLTKLATNFASCQATHDICGIIGFARGIIGFSLATLPEGLISQSTIRFRFRRLCTLFAAYCFESPANSVLVPAARIWTPASETPRAQKSKWISKPGCAARTWGLQKLRRLVTRMARWCRGQGTSKGRTEAVWSMAAKKNSVCHPSSHYRDYHPGALSLNQVYSTHLKIG